MTDIQLWAVVEVPQDKRVSCQAPGCEHSIYKRVHVVSSNGSMQLLGSSCFRKLYGHAGPQAALYGASKGQQLSAQEHEVLLKNTMALIAQLKLASESARNSA